MKVGNTRSNKEKGSRTEESFRHWHEVRMLTQEPYSYALKKATDTGMRMWVQEPYVLKRAADTGMR